MHIRPFPATQKTPPLHDKLESHTPKWMMTMQLYDLALFVHMLGLIALFGGFVLYHRAGARLRAALTVEEATTWVKLLDGAAPMFPSGLGMLLVSGLYMTYARWQDMQPWIVVGMIGVVGIGILGGALVDRHRKAIGRQLAGTAGPLMTEQARLMRDPGMWMTVGLLNGAALGIVFVMSTKPQWLISVGVVVTTTVLGAVIGSSVARAR